MTQTVRMTVRRLTRRTRDSEVVTGASTAIVEMRDLVIQIVMRFEAVIAMVVMVVGGEVEMTVTVIDVEMGVEKVPAMAIVVEMVVEMVVGIGIATILTVIVENDYQIVTLIVEIEDEEIMAVIAVIDEIIVIVTESPTVALPTVAMMIAVGEERI